MKIHEGLSKAEFGTLDAQMTISSLIKERSKSITGDIWCLLHLTDAVRILGLRQGLAEIDKAETWKIRVLRVFGENGEIHVWRTGEEFSWRVREDGVGDLTEYADQEQFLWGDKADSDGQSVVESGRGNRIVFSVPVTQWNLPVKMTVRNYIDYQEDGLLHFIDARVTGLNVAGGSSHA